MFRHDLIYDLIAFQLILLLIALDNIRILRRARRHTWSRQGYPKVSILVPARNEEANIGRCVASLLAQDYPDFELLVLDDESTDRTQAILETIARRDSRLEVLNGQPPAPGWTGKNWACHQLASRALGDLLYFTDADTNHQPQTLRAFVGALEGEGADLLGGFPRQETGTWGERLIVPFFSWAVCCFTPLALGYRLRFPWLSTAVGQALLFRRSAYEGIGGHRAVRASIVDDLDLARLIKTHGYRWRMMDAADLISCRMYRSGREAAAGLSKNLFAAFGFRVAPYLFAWAWLLILFLKPFIDLGLYILGIPLGIPVAYIFACIGLAFIVWLVPSRGLRLPLWSAILYPVTIVIMAAVAARSLWLGLCGRLTWKDRALVRPRLRLF